MHSVSAPSVLRRSAGRGSGARRRWLGIFRPLLVATALVTSDVREVRGAWQDAAENAAYGVAVKRPDCRDCHYCDQPTREDPCLLNPCARDGAAVASTALWPSYEGPAVVILDELEDAYLPVPFDHKGHAQMAAMTAGCTACHHYSPEGQQHPECKTCHDISSAGTDVNKPGLKGAYHQLCLNCHREWIDETDCAICHMPKAGGSAARATPPPTKDDILGLMHPPIPEPETDIYRGMSAAETGTQVVFRHAKHVKEFSLDCVNCHRESSCASCHRETAEPQRPRTVVEHHQPCIHCHKRDMDLEAREADRCDRCHWQAGKPEPGSFDHASTGWALRAYHQPVSCRACHSDVPFSGPDNGCIACHDGWDPETFSHGVTGQVLNEDHAEIDCDVCHAELKFDVAPVCDDCHDVDDDGIAFPARRPGPDPGAEAGAAEASADAATD